MLKFRFNGGKFVNDLTRAKEQIKKNVQADSYEILEIVNKHTEPKVPYETGRLRASVMRPNGMLVEGDFMSQEIEYSARNPRTGYDYAEIQHNNLAYKHRFGESEYLSKGMAESENEVYRLIERDVDLGLREALKGGR